MTAWTDLPGRREAVAVLAALREGDHEAAERTLDAAEPSPVAVGLVEIVLALAWAGSALSPALEVEAAWLRSLAVDALELVGNELMAASLTGARR